jgi:hypothetical protein
MPDHLTTAEALQRLIAAARNGNRAKRRLIRKLAGMTPVQLSRINPEVFARLGPQGLSLFASLNKSIRNVAPVAAPAPTKRAETIFERSKRRWHFAHPLLKCLTLTALCGVMGMTASRLSNPLLEVVAGRQTEVIAGWPVCERLDLDERGCVYRASSDQLTIDRVVALTGLMPDVVVAANPHLDFRAVLPRGPTQALRPRQ